MVLITSVLDRCSPLMFTYFVAIGIMPLLKADPFLQSVSLYGEAEFLHEYTCVWFH